MAGIIGIQGKDKNAIAVEMLDKIKHRGKNKQIIKVDSGLTLGFISNEPELKSEGKDNIYSLSKRTDSTSVIVSGNKLSLKRDKFGVEPLYYVILEDNNLAFASEVKALLRFNRKINELEPGYILEDLKLKKYYELVKEQPLKQDHNELSKILHDTLQNAIKKRVVNQKIGAWLSGGLDSSVISALAKPFVNDYHTFAVGFPGAPDLKYARIVADHIKSNHHEKLISFDEITKVLPDVIYNLESFDGLLVRSSIMNFIVGRLASEYVDEVFSGEAGDELFAGYQYIKDLPTDKIADELIDITKRLHNTALQRVDRSSSGSGTTAHVPFLDEDVVELAIRIPVEYKLNNGVEKWILRRAVASELPNDVLMRTKSKFWEGSGMGEHFYSYAEGLISDTEFKNERNIKCGWQLNSKEELMYYRIFKGHFGDLDNIDWMGRTKGVAPDAE